MYCRILNGKVQSSFLKGVEGFIEFAISNPTCVKKGLIKCPCTLRKCRNKQYVTPLKVSEHLRRNGFVL